MISFGLLAIWVTLLIYQTYKWMFYRPHNFPPGPPRIPIFGAYGFMLLLNYKHLHKAIDWLCTFYKSDVIGFYTGPYLTAVAHSTEAGKECMNNTDLDGKPGLPLALLREPNFKPFGIFFASGDLWHQQRRFALRHLRDYGFGRRFDELELELSDEIQDFIDLLRNGPRYDYEKKYHDGSSALVPGIFGSLFSNTFAKVILNQRMPREKLGDLHEAADHVFFFVKNADLWGRLFSIVYWVPTIFPELSGYDMLRESAMKYYNCIKPIVDEQYATFDKNFERHFLDKYFLNMENNKDDPESNFFYSQIVSLTGDFFLPTFVANSQTLQFLLERLYIQPEILKRCQKEIDDIVGQSRLPTLDDRINLPYVEATIREILRHKTLNPSGFPHLATADTKLCGYNIPNGTIVYSSLHGSHTDEKAWDQPELFKPERFLDENGKFSPKLDKSVPFGAGKRLCAGETFARNTLYLVTAAIVQNFNFEMPENEKMPTTINTGLVQYLPDFRMKFVSR